MNNNNVIDQSKDITILELLDRVLNKGVILTGDVVRLSLTIRRC